VVGESGAEYRGFVFADSDLYKVIEAVAWEIARTGTRQWDAWLDDVIALVERVQDASGYVHSWIQGVHPEKRFAELEWTHELYVLGHMVQAAVALDRAAGRDDLLAIALRFVDLVDRRFGPGREEGICGHPEIETALVELYRHTAEPRYLRLATRMVDLRGRGLLKTGHFGPQYFQDHLPVREARSPVGHAVRQLYLDAGVTDVHLETGEPALLDALQARWDAAHGRKMYVTGAFGSRHRDEAFGDDYELPSDRAYAETCATIADVHWTWRMILAGGDGRMSDAMERELHNALAAAVDTTGTRFFYSNPLQLRPDRYSEENAPRERRAWYECACCPPNLARLTAQLSAYVASVTGDALELHHYTDADVDIPEHIGEGVLEVRTDYPRAGRIELRLRGRLAPGAVLALRVPGWSASSITLEGADNAGTRTPGPDGYLRVGGSAEGDDRWVLELDMRPRWTRAHPRVDALRGCLALERGPVVYCVEQTDLPGAVTVDSLELDPTVPVHEASIDDSGPGPVPPRLTVGCRTVHAPAELYRPAKAMDTRGEAVTVTAVPFCTWGNRGASAMRVWLPARASALADVAEGDV
jgi:DUF1680 family protein